ncbi:MAG: hypothetical protein DYG96_12165 [Chlorobi bacterium CHB2]|nr:hypothetical protein [Chlorobi bacterium CHB2]
MITEEKVAELVQGYAVALADIVTQSTRYPVVVVFFDTGDVAWWPEEEWRVELSMYRIHHDRFGGADVVGTVTLTRRSCLGDDGGMNAVGLSVEEILAKFGDKIRGEVVRGVEAWSCATNLHQ